MFLSIFYAQWASWGVASVIKSFHWLHNSWLVEIPWHSFFSLNLPIKLFDAKAVICMCYVNCQCIWMTYGSISGSIAFIFLFVGSFCPCSISCWWALLQGHCRGLESMWRTCPCCAAKHWGLCIYLLWIEKWCLDLFLIIIMALFLGVWFWFQTICSSHI